MLNTRLAACLIASTLAFSQSPYTWKSVQIVGGGFVDGFVFHPTQKDLRYARTDMGGAYRFEPATKSWTPLLDWVSYKDLNLMGVESIALDPQDPSKVYMACGTYTTDESPCGAILRSSDQGRTFQRTNVPIKFGGNENGRGNGERMMVDPNDGHVLFLGTRHAGLWKSVDGAATWKKVETFPADVLKRSDEEAKLPFWIGGGRSSISFVVFDPASGSKAKASRTLYAGVSVMGKPGLYRSLDGGETWAAVPGQPTAYRPNHAVLAQDGNLYITYGTDPGPMAMEDGALWKLNTKTGAWTDLTPDKPGHGRKFGYAAVSVDAHNPQVLIVSSFYRPQTGLSGDDIFRSIDGGKTWKTVFGSGGQYDYTLAPYVQRTGIHWLFDIEIDPANPDHAMFTTGYGGWETFNLTEMDKGKPTTWSVMSTGIEETVALALCSPTKGAPVVTAIGDYSGNVHWDLDKPEPNGSPLHPFLRNTSDVVAAEKNPEVMVRVGRGENSGNIGYSLDSGRTWTEPTSVPKGSEGKLALASNGSAWVWTPGENVPHVTTDRGTTWKPCVGLGKDARVVADRVNPKVFYSLSLFDGKLFISQDGAATFTEQKLVLPDGLPKRATKSNDRGDDRGGQDQVYATPGLEGDLWVAAFNGLYHSTKNTGSGFARMPGVDELHAFGFGKAAPGAAFPALYMVGTVNGQRGIFRSIDAGLSWVRINDDAHQWGLILHVTGDPKQYGRVYVGTHGRGTFYGDPK